MLRKIVILLLLHGLARRAIRVNTVSHRSGKKKYALPPVQHEPEFFGVVPVATATATVKGPAKVSDKYAANHPAQKYIVGEDSDEENEMAPPVPRTEFFSIVPVPVDVSYSEKEAVTKPAYKVFAEKLNALIKKCTKCADLLGVMLNEFMNELYPMKGFVSLAVHVIDMLHDTKWMGEPGDPDATRFKTRAKRLTTVVVDFASKELLFDRKDCFPDDDIFAKTEICTVKCLMSICTGVVYQYSRHYDEEFRGLLAILVSIFKDIYKSTQAIRQNYNEAKSIAVPCWQLTIAFTRLVAFTWIGVSVGKSPAVIANSWLKVVQELGENWEKELEKKAAERAEKLLAERSGLYAVPANLGQICADRVASIGVYASDNMTEGPCLNGIGDILAVPEWTDSEDYQMILSSFLRFAWMDKAGVQHYHWNMIKDRYKAVLEIDTTIMLDDLGDEDSRERKEQACRVARLVCANKNYVVTDGKDFREVDPYNFDNIDGDEDFAFKGLEKVLEDGLEIPCCLTTTPPTCQGREMV